MKKVLVAEDDRFIASAYRVKLAKEGFELKLAVDGDEVMTILEQGFLPDVILLDLVMPKKDGFAVLSEVKSNPAWEKIPVIVASNLGQKEDIERARALGAADYIVKSEVSMGDIVGKISSLAGI